jgi:hypothetical protein
MLLPIKLLTWSSLLLENLALFTIWPLRSRQATVVAMVLFHVGIDITMNMHIFELVSILGWLFFLARPMGSASSSSHDANDEGDSLVKEEPNVVILLDDKASMKGRSRIAPSVVCRSSRLRRVFLTNPFIAFFLLSAWAHSNPGGMWESALPADHPILPVVRGYNSLAKWVRKGTGSLMSSLGCWQHQWLIFCGGGNSPGYKWYAYIEYAVADRYQSDEENDPSRLLQGTTPNAAHESEPSEAVPSVPTVIKSMTWSSPDWFSMPWWQLKRHQRTMLFFENVASSTRNRSAKVLAAQRGLCRGLFRQYSHGAGSIIPGEIIEGQDDFEYAVSSGTMVEISSIALQVVESRGPKYPPYDLGPWDVPAIRKDLVRQTIRNLYYYTTKPDKGGHEEQCRQLARKGGCDDEESARFLWETCLESCSRVGSFNLALSVHPGTRIHNALPGKRRQYYTVLEKQEGGLFLIQNEQDRSKQQVDLFDVDFEIIEEVSNRPVRSTIIHETNFEENVKVRGHGNTEGDEKVSREANISSGEKDFPDL